MAADRWQHKQFILLINGRMILSAERRDRRKDYIGYTRKVFFIPAEMQRTPRSWAQSNCVMMSSWRIPHPVTFSCRLQVDSDEEGPRP
jgi:hypothetical protein